jgi:capsular polysaccharide biosynthesis protein
VDLRVVLGAVRRHKAIFGAAVVVGLLAGVVFSLARPPMLASKVLVVLPGSHFVQTEVLIADSDPVLSRAGASLRPAVGLAELRRRVEVASVTSNVLEITALGRSAVQAEAAAEAVARSFVVFVASPASPGGRASAQVLESATPATGAAPSVRLAETAGLGLLAGVLAGVVIAAAVGRGDRRLRERDEIAGAIGVPVLASLPVGHPPDADGWVGLLEDYEPGAVHAWSLRKVLRQLGVTEARGAGVSVAVLSLAGDRGALAVGPQLAVFAASLGVPTTLVVGPQQDPGATAMLATACTMASASPGRPRRLQFVIGDYQDLGRSSGVALTVVVTVVDGRAARPSGLMRTTATVLAVSAGVATAEQLAHAAVNVTGDSRDIAGIIVADPDPADRTTGGLPQLGQLPGPAQPARRRVARLNGTTAENRQ